MLQQMAMTTGDPPDRTFETAMDWLLRLQAAPGDSSLRAAVDAWCRANPAHAHAWARAQETWNAVGDVAPAHVAEWPTKKPPVQPIANASPAHTRARLILPAAAIAACLVLFLFPGLMAGLRADYATSTAQRREISLQDGSRVSLAPQTALDVRLEPDRRLAALLDGEAFFEVAADPKRPFVVNAAGVEVAVVGTAFDVRVSRKQVVVAVRNGIVDVREAGSQTASVRLTAGNRAVVDRMTRKLEQDTIAPVDVASWRDGRLFVDGATVDEVVDELGRYHSVWIVVADSRMAKQHVTGLFDLNDIDRALAALVQPFGGRVRKVTPLLQVLSAP
jgi:transmembrane sensor